MGHTTLTGGRSSATPHLTDAGAWSHDRTGMARSNGARRPYDPLLGSGNDGHRTGTAADRDSEKNGSGDGKAESDQEPEVTPRVKRMRTEAVLLLSKGPLTTRKLATLALLADGTEARTMIRELNQTYERLGRAMRIEKVAGGFRLLTRPNLAPWLRKLTHIPAPVRLSPPMMETLAVVAYRQPVSRADAEAVRGVACGELLRQLMQRDLIRIAGRSEELGRPYLYGTTKRFLQLFGLTGTDALPKIDWQTIRDDVESSSIESATSESTTSTKESVVSTAMVSADPSINTAEMLLPGVVTPSEIPAVSPDPNSPGPEDLDPSAVIEDEEDDLYEGGFDTDDDEEIDDDEFSDDWDDDDEADDDEDESDDDEDPDDDESDSDDDWEEVGDDDEEDWDEEEDEEDEWDDDDESADDDEDWSE